MWASETSEMVTAVATVASVGATVALVLATVILALVALRQLRDSRDANHRAAESHRELLADQFRREVALETLRMCARVDYDPVLTSCLRRIWRASNQGRLYERDGPVPLNDVHIFANYLDGMAIGVIQELLSNDIAKDHLGVFVQRFVEVILPGVSSLRNYAALVELHARWFPPPPPSPVPVSYRAT